MELCAAYLQVVCGACFGDTSGVNTAEVELSCVCFNAGV